MENAKDLPLISVVIPHYNCVSLLNRLLDTIPMAGVQLIVVDDKSDENIHTVKQRVLSRGGIFIHNTTDKKNAGVCRNLGLQQVKGKWLVFADADDEFQENAFEIMHRYMDSDADIVFFSPISKSITGGPSKRHVKFADLVKGYLALPDMRNETWIRYKFLTPVSKMIRTKLIMEHNVLFDEVPASNDIMFSMKSAYYARKIEVSAQCIYCITELEKSINTTHDEINGWSRVKVFKDEFFFTKKYLDTREFGFWNLSALYMIRNIIQKGYSPKFVLAVCRYYIQQGVPIFSLQGFMNSVRWWLSGKYK